MCDFWPDFNLSGGAGLEYEYEKNSKLILKSYYLHKWYKTHSAPIDYSYKADTRYKTDT